MRIAIAAMAAGLTFTVQATAAPRDSGWVVFPRADDEDRGCYAVKHVHKDVSFVIYANPNEGFGIGVTGTSWRLSKGEEVNGAAAFDNLPPLSLSGKVEDERTILLFDNNGAEEESPLQSSMESAQGLRMSYGKAWVSLPLAGSRKAVGDLWDCVNDHEPKEAAAPAPTREPAKPVLPRGVKELIRSDCLLEVDGVRKIDGPCDYHVLWSNGWKLFGDGIVGEVEPTVDNGASFKTKWSENSAGDDMAELGDMRWTGKCWEGARGKICAFALGQRPDAYRAPGKIYPTAATSQSQPAPSTAAAGKRTRTVKGVISYGRNDSSIEGDDVSYGFLTKSAVADQIFKACKMNDRCEITGVFDEQKEWIVSVDRVEKR